MRDHAGAGGARLHLLVPQRRARAQLRPQPRRDPHGAPGARHHGTTITQTEYYIFVIIIDYFLSLLDFL